MDCSLQVDGTGAENREIEKAQPRFIEETYVITAYCPCVKCCGKTDGITATGTKATQGRTIAVDPTKIPYGTKVEFDGITYTAEDCGCAIKNNRIDLYFDDHQSALNFGRQTKLVKIYN